MAAAHPLYGIKGVAAALIIWMVCSAILGAVGAIAVLNAAPTTGLEREPILVAGAWLAIQALVCISLLVMRKPTFLPWFTFFLLAGIPLALLLDAASGESSSSVKGGIVMAAFLTYYVRRSRRIRVTTRQEVRSDDPILKQLLGAPQNGPITRQSTPTHVTATVPGPLSVPVNEREQPPSCEPADARFIQALDEVEQGHTDKATWARALAASDGNLERAKAHYIAARVKKLHDAATEV
jgi:hypothetical protein